MKRKAKRHSKKQPRQPLINSKQPADLKQGYGYQMPPALECVLIYFDQKELTSQARTFYDHYEEAYWLTPKGTRIRNWKVLATDWIYNHIQENKLHQRLATNRSVFNDM